MKSRPWLIFIVVLAVLALAWIAAQPLFAFQALAAAGQSGDRDRLESLVDFPAVRADLKAQLDARIQGAIDQDKGLSDSPFGALGALVGPRIVDQVVEAAVTPDGVAAIVRSGRAPLTDLTGKKTALPPPPETAPPEAPVSLGAPARPKPRFAYTGLDTFRATTFSRGGQPLGWTMRREGLSWKLVGIELPPARP